MSSICNIGWIATFALSVSDLDTDVWAYFSGRNHGKLENNSNLYPLWTCAREVREKERISLSCFGTNRFGLGEVLVWCWQREKITAQREEETIKTGKTEYYQPLWQRTDRQVKYSEKQNLNHSNDFTEQISLFKPLGWERRWGWRKRDRGKGGFSEGEPVCVCRTLTMG